jgi:2-polyprenyl-3-methyl-5-hydroxy-6-metoxy-1,4-benzoquinol methylase
MNTSASRPSETVVLKENIQDFYSSILEYYDELFPTDVTAVPFFNKLQEDFRNTIQGGTIPLCRYLGIGCATGNLENALSSATMDITGIDKNADMVETAKRRMKRGYSTTRFFEMSTLDIKRFLKAGSFHIIACLDNMLPYIADETLLRKFFYDAKALLAPGGTLVIQTINMDNLAPGKPFQLKPRSSIRVNLTTTWVPADEGKYIVDAALELGNGKKIILQKTTEVLALPTSRVESYAREAGFKSCSLQADFSGTPWDSESPDSVLVLR